MTIMPACGKALGYQAKACAAVNRAGGWGGGRPEFLGLLTFHIGSHKKEQAKATTLLKFRLSLS